VKNISFRLKAVKAAIALAFISGFLLSPNLWLKTNRFFPLIRPVDFIPVIESPYDLIVLFLFIGLIITWLFIEKWWIGCLAVTVLLIMLLQDEMRWQPWVYLYLLMLLPFLLQSKNNDNHKATMNCLQWIIAGVYVWSGTHKFNADFLSGTFAQMIQSSGLDVQLGRWKMVGYAIPCLELSMGIGLATTRFRKVAIWLAILMHLGILFYLSPAVANYNSIVYPWNVAMMAFVLLLFFRNSDRIYFPIRDGKLNVMRTVMIALVWIIPILNLLGAWDHYLSFSLYSNKTPYHYIAIEKNDIPKIDKRLENYFADVPGLQGGQMIDVNKWTLSDLNVPFYPETRTFKKLGEEFCGLGIANENLVFLQLHYSQGKPIYTKFNCAELSP
jgi:hypothetical protein